MLQIDGSIYRILDNFRSHPAIKNFKRNFEITIKFTFKPVSSEFVKDIVRDLFSNKAVGGDIPVNFQKIMILLSVTFRGGFRGGRGGCPFFVITCFFCSHFEELQTVLFEVEMIINNAPLTYVYPNTIETCLTPNHLLFGRQLLYSSNTTSTVVRNLTVLSSTTDKINRISKHFLDRWRHEFT